MENSFSFHEEEVAHLASRLHLQVTVTSVFVGRNLTRYSRKECLIFIMKIIIHFVAFYVSVTSRADTDDSIMPNNLILYATSLKTYCFYVKVFSISNHFHDSY